MSLIIRSPQPELSLDSIPFTSPSSVSYTDEKPDFLDQTQCLAEAFDKGTFRTEGLKDCLDQLKQLSEDVLSGRLDPEVGFKTVQPLLWSLEDYFVSAKMRIEAHGSRWQAQYKEIRDVLSEFQSWSIGYSLPKKGLVGRVSQFFFVPNDPFEKFFLSVQTFQNELKNLQISPRDDRRAQAALKRELKRERRPFSGMSDRKKQLYSALFGSILLGAQGIRFGEELRQAIEALRTIPNQVVKKEDTCPLYKTWEVVPDELCFPIEKLEENMVRAMRRIAPAILENEQELQTYGNKHRNLIKMALLKEAVDLPGVAIPLPHGLSDETIQGFLRQKAPRVFAAWDELVKLHEIHSDEKPFLETDQAKELLQQIDREIETAFAHFKLPQEMLSWMEGLQKKGSYLMVRSTGAEDSKEMANAGGNASEAYVAPHSHAFQKAAGVVVRSYFSKESLQNRINSQTNPFTEPLKLAVTAQELVGEEVGGSKNPADIPISFVLFTNEPLYVGGEKFRVMRVSASYGHGEGVVKGQGIATDTALILLSESKPDQLLLLYNNQHKLHRLAPLQSETGKVELQKVENPPSLQREPAIGPKQLRDLFSSAIVMEAFFEEEPTDIEGVIKNGQIHFVQARPIVRKPLLPTYLDFKGQEIVQHRAQTLVVGNASVVKIEKKEDVLFVPTLQDALRFSIHSPPKLVIVNHPEPENSHPVVLFSGYAIPCLYVPDSKLVESLLNQIDGTHSLAACMQRGSLSMWETDKLDTSIQEGFAVHPAQVAISLAPTSRFVKAEAPSAEMSELLSQLRDGKTPLQTLDQIEQHPAVRQLRAKRIALGEIYKNQKAPPMIQERIAILKSLDEKISASIKEMRAQIEKPTERLQTLFHAKVLETLLVGTAASGLGHYSLNCVKPLLEEIDQLKAYQSQLTHQSHTLDLFLYGKQASQDAFARWKQFLLRIEAKIEKGGISFQEWSTFSSFIQSMHTAGTLPTWLTFFQNDSIEVPPDQAFIHSMLLKQQALSQIQIDDFADPVLFSGSWKELNEKIDYFSSKNWQEALKTASPIARSVAYKTMEQVVGLLDTAAKTVKSSQKFSNENQKIQQFKEMLSVYLNLSRVWAQEMVPSGKINMHRDFPLRVYFDRVQILLAGMSDTDENQLRPSADFSVAAAIIGTGTAFERHEPRSLEDVLTLSHQNCLVSLTALNQALLSEDQIKNSFLPESLKQAIGQIEQTNWGREVQRIGIQVSDQEIVFKYNIPLDNHSGSMELHYDMQSGRMILKGHFLGEARRRWGEIASCFKALEAAKVLIFHRPLMIGEQELTFEAIVDPGSINQVLGEYMSAAEYSLGGRFSDALINLNNRYKNQQKIQKIIIDYFKTEINKITNRIGLLKFLLETKNIEPEKVLTEANGLIQSTNINSHIDGIRLFVILIKMNIGIVEAIQAAKKGSESTDESVLLDALGLFSALIKKDQGITEAIQAAKKGSESTDPLLLLDALKLFSALINKNQGITEAIQAAKKGSESTYELVLLKALELFSALISKDRGITEAIQAAKKGSESTVPFVQRKALELFSTIIHKDQGITDVIQAAKKGFESTDPSIHLAALKLFSTLIHKDQGITDAIQAAKKGSESTDPSIHLAALELFSTLIHKDQGITDAIQAAKKGFESTDPSIHPVALKLFSTLIHKDQGITDVIQAAKKGSESIDPSIHLSALKLFSTLIHKDQGITDAIQAAKKGSESTNPSIHLAALELFSTLIHKDQGITDAIQAAEKGLESTNQSIQIKSLKLIFDGLKNQAAPAGAIEIINKSLESNNESLKIIAFDLLSNFINHQELNLNTIEMFKKGIRSTNRNAQTKTLQFFNTLAMESKALSDVIEVAKNGMESTDEFVQEQALEIFKTLVNKDEGIEDAIQAAKKGSESINPFAQRGALNLFKALINKNKGIAEVFQVVKNRFELIEPFNQWNFLELIFDIINTQGMSSNAIEILKNVMDSENLYLQIKIIQFLTDLSLEDKAPWEVIELAKEGLESTNFELRSRSLSLTSNLIKSHARTTPEAIEFGKKRMESIDPNEQIEMIKLFDTLVSKGEGIAEAIQVAKKGIESDYSYVKQDAAKLFRNLIGKNEGLVDAFQAAKKTKEKPFNQILAKNLFAPLVEAAKKKMESKNRSTKSKALKLFTKLVQENEGVSEAFEAARKTTENFTSKRNNKLASANLELWNALEENQLRNRWIHIPHSIFSFLQNWVGKKIGVYST